MTNSKMMEIKKASINEADYSIDCCVLIKHNAVIAILNTNPLGNLLIVF